VNVRIVRGSVAVDEKPYGRGLGVAQVVDGRKRSHLVVKTEEKGCCNLESS